MKKKCWFDCLWEKILDGFLERSIEEIIIYGKKCELAEWTSVKINSELVEYIWFSTTIVYLPNNQFGKFSILCRILIHNFDNGNFLHIFLLFIVIFSDGFFQIIIFLSIVYYILTPAMNSCRFHHWIQLACTLQLVSWPNPENRGAAVILRRAKSLRIIPKPPIHISLDGCSKEKPVEELEEETKSGIWVKREHTSRAFFL